MATQSPDQLLNKLGLQYGDRASDLQGSPAKIVANLIALTAAFDAGTYQTPNFITAPYSSATVDPKNVALDTVLTEAYKDALRSGSVTATHKAADKLNKLAMVASGAETVPPPDFEIIARQKTPLGDAARWICNWAVENETDAGDFFGRNGAAIRKFAKGQK